MRFSNLDKEKGRKQHYRFLVNKVIINCWFVDPVRPIVCIIMHDP